MVSLRLLSKYACMHAVFPGTPSFTSHPVVVWTGLNISDDCDCFLTVTHKTELKFLQ